MSGPHPSLYSIDGCHDRHMDYCAPGSGKSDMFGDITELRTFVQIVKTGSLTAASRDMGLALSVVSKRLAKLERRTETQLIARSTRSLALTTEGQQLFHCAQRILAEIDEAESVLLRGKMEPQGLLRVSAPLDLGRTHVSPVCCELVRSYPHISVDLVLTDRLVELISERMDIVIRIGPPQDSELIMRKLSDNHRIMAASPEYVERRGMPASPEDLVNHDCLLYRGSEALWRLVGQRGVLREVKVSSRLHCDNGEVARDWAIAGCGVVMKSWIDLIPDLASGRLMQVLPDWRSEPAPICALFVQGRRMPIRVRLFLEAMVQRFACIANDRVQGARSVVAFGKLSVDV